LAKIGQNAQQDKSIYQFNPIQSNPRFASTNPSTTSSSRLLDDCCKKSPFGTYVYLPAGWHHRRRRQLLGIQIKNCDPNLVAGYPRKLANCSVEHDKAPNGRRTSSPSESKPAQSAVYTDVCAHLANWIYVHGFLWIAQQPRSPDSFWNWVRHRHLGCWALALTPMISESHSSRTLREFYKKHNRNIS